VCLPLRTVEPDPKSAAVYEQLYRHYRDVYFALGRRDAAPVALGKVLPELRKIAAEGGGGLSLLLGLATSAAKKRARMGACGIPVWIP